MLHLEGNPPEIPGQIPARFQETDRRVFPARQFRWPISPPLSQRMRRLCCHHLLLTASMQSLPRRKARLCTRDTESCLAILKRVFSERKEKRGKDTMFACGPCRPLQKQQMQNQANATTQVNGCQVMWLPAVCKN